MSRFLRQMLGFELDARPFFELAVELVAAQPQAIWCQQRAHRIHATVFKARLGVSLETVGAGVDIPGIDQ